MIDNEHKPAGLASSAVSSYSSASTAILRAHS